MTTTIKVTSHNYPASVETSDLVGFQQDGAVGQVSPQWKVVETRILKPEDGEQSFYCTTSRRVVVTDIEYDDPRVTAAF
ncbi:MAG: hypothetical protein ABSF67_20415 [Roseiarcus sp.]|jgi:hypothetical protein